MLSRDGVLRFLLIVLRLFHERRAAPAHRTAERDGFALPISP